MTKVTLSNGSVLPLGKYKGRLVCEIMKENPNYILWMHENVTRVKFSESVIQFCKKNKIINEEEVLWKDRKQ